MERYSQVVPFRVDFMCPKCKLGKMVTYSQTQTQPPQFKSKCQACKEEMITQKPYPGIIYKDIEELEAELKKQEEEVKAKLEAEEKKETERITFGEGK